MSSHRALSANPSDRHAPAEAEMTSDRSTARHRTERRTFGTTLRELMHRPTCRYTPGLLAKLAGLPKATVVNWCDDRVARPRSSPAVAAVCDALRLDRSEIDALFAAAGLAPPQRQPPIAPAFDDAPVGLYSTTLEGRILCANRTLVAMLGYDRPAYYGLDVARDLYLEARDRAEWLDELRSARTLLRRPVVAKRADGEPIELLDSCTAVYDERGHILRLDGVWERARGALDAG